MSTQTDYITKELAEGRLTPEHIQALTLYYQGAHTTAGARDGLPGPITRGQLEARYPSLFSKAKTLEELGRWLQWPLAFLRAVPASPTVRKPWVTSGFRTADRKDHDGLDMFYRWEPGDQPNFVGDGGCAGRNADGTPKWVVPYGSHAMAAAEGTVTIAGPSPTGYRVWVDHGNGWRTGYFHLETLTGSAKAGSHVSTGTALGLVGHNPSPAVDGRHLHFELSPVDRYSPVDPEPCLVKIR